MVYTDASFSPNVRIMLISLNSRPYRDLVAELVRLRESLELTQRDLAKLLKRSQTYIAKVEKNQKYIELFEFVPYCHALKADPAELFERFCLR